MRDLDTLKHRFRGSASRPRMGHSVALTIIIVTLTGCSNALCYSSPCVLTVPAVSVTLPQARLIEPLPLTIGAYYDPALRSLVASQSSRVTASTTLTWIIALGQPSINLVDQALTATFDRVLPATARSWSGGDNGPDAIIEPAFEQIRIIELRTTQFPATYQVTITYRVTLRSRSGEPLAEWTISGTGTSAQALAVRSVAAAAEEALRSAAAELMLGLRQRQDVQQLLRTKGVSPTVTRVTSEKPPPWPPSADRLAIVSPDSFGERSIPACVADNVQRARPDLLVVPSREFQDALFPYLEPSTAPESAEGLSRLLAKPEVSARVNDLQVRYVAIIRGIAVPPSQQEAAVHCLVGTCLGLLWWNGEPHAFGVTWDLAYPVIGAERTGACAVISGRIVSYVGGTGAPSR